MTRRRASTATRRLVLTAVLAVLGVAAFCTPASASHAHLFRSAITGSGTNTLSAPGGLAVDKATHDLYVTDAANVRVEKFDASGGFILMFGDGVNQTTAGDVCTQSSGNTCQPGTDGTSPGAFSTPTFIAVDNSNGPSAADVYVANSTSLVQKFDSSGNLITTWGAGGQLDGSASPDGPFQEGINGIGVGGSGNLYVYSSTRVFSFAEDGTFLSSYTIGSETAAVGIGIDSNDFFYKVRGFPSVAKFASDGNIVNNFFDTCGCAGGLAVDQSSDNVYVHHGTSIVRFDSEGTQLEEFGEGKLASGGFLAVDSATHDAYAVDPGNARVLRFAFELVPTVATGAPTDLARTSVSLHADVDPDGGTSITDCHFEYGTGLSYGTSVPCSQGTPYASATPVSADLAGLSPETTYHYRIVSTNGIGATTRGSDVSFTTPPAIIDLSTDEPADITQVGATLIGSFTGDGDGTHFYFEWGTSTAYGHVTATAPGDEAGSPVGPTSVSTELEGLSVYLPLSPFYHYRIVAANSLGSTYGQDQIFHTVPPFVPTITESRASAVTEDAATLSAMVTPGFGDTVYFFEFGTTADYGTRTPTSSTIGNDNSSHPAIALLTGLPSGTAYHFRAVALNFTGTTHGPDQTFTTTEPRTAPSTPAQSPVGSQSPPGGQQSKVIPRCKKNFVKRKGKCVRRKHKKPRRSRGDRQ